MLRDLGSLSSSQLACLLTSLRFQSKFVAFYPYSKNFNNDSFDYEALAQTDYVYMRWKEHFLVSQSVSQSVTHSRKLQDVSRENGVNRLYSVYRTLWFCEMSFLKVATSEYHLPQG